MRLALCLAALTAALVTAAFAGDHPDLNGVWQGAANGETLTIHQKDDAVEIVEAGKQTIDIQCKTTGQACKVKGGEVTLWYNGPMLVVMETHGTRVIKKRLKPSQDGKSLEVEVIHIEPAGNAEKFTLDRRSGS